ncbi:TBC1 domain family member 24 isoform X7 [Drosophila erecta]|uniref:Skywalker, isoform D n=5 Tax=melanogaster subgroup TaxID=32351 RepID=Q0E8N9_DROME|nr:skywalker, isoform E [Drosophila melanogaster]NP_724301.2 skywalker, isoform G [Drosophila melanogaster]NP_995739.1 skywalker, isoform D [Drosophila melanogaster]XP_015012030.1 TBC1 domain family member 24 isoform X7 [Drosophila erecta]XP_015052281.1 GTPase-activating protein skywalker isoform X9 [Drosophila yakuba]XP_016025696.1 GTPase-activating protein skywalker isoform X12 [Drosophila simulans]XP_032583206.1 GTPase-activating protein skywalker isoform X8 [Drosophila sechellia]XP_03315|eukprot:NP_724300.2 skywalker, isoform E [Drosophila melanogaster]
MPYHRGGDASSQADKLSGIVEESDLYEGFAPHVETSEIKTLDFYNLPKQTGKEPALRSYTEIQQLLQQGKKRDVKNILRENSWPINSPIRAQLWPMLCGQHQTKQQMLDGFYWEMVHQVFGTTELSEKPIMLPAFVDATHCLPYHLTSTGRAVADRIVNVLGYDCPDITYSPVLYPITSILLHFMSEEEAYICLAGLVGSKEKVFINQTKLQHEVTWKTVMQIAKKHTKSATSYFQRICPGLKLERIFMDWCWWILAGLPFQHLVRIMDCYFHEGIKVLYRVALVILNLFHKECQSNNEWSPDNIKNDIGNALIKFCKKIPVSPAKLLHAAFSIRGLSTQYISRIFIKTEMLLKSRSVLTSGSKQLIKSRSSDNLPTSQSQVNIQMMSHTLTIRELFTLWSWLPVRITMYQPVLLYTTEEHGCSLTTFYVRVEQHEPTLLMIKTCNNEVFGAYCSSRWFERNVKDDKGQRQAYFGTGETFLFSLYPERAKYPWVGIEGDKDLGHSSELFMAADSKMITIGGGEGQAIWMDENIRFGKTDSCKTFNNPPLCPSGDFEIRVLEVYGFVGI